VRILNRADCCGDRLKGVEILIGGLPCGILTEETKDKTWYTVKCANGPVMGNDIKIISTRDDFINLAEVQVWTKKDQACESFFRASKGMCVNSEGVKPKLLGNSSILDINGCQVFCT
jgi:hypothetical protein